MSFSVQAPAEPQPGNNSPDRTSSIARSARLPTVDFDELASPTGAVDLAVDAVSADLVGFRLTPIDHRRPAADNRVDGSLEGSGVI